MTAATIVLLCALFGTATYVRRRVGSTMSLSLMLFSALLLVHGIALLIYLNVTGPDTFIFERALAPVDRDATISRLMLAVSVMFASLVAGTELANGIVPRWRRRARHEARVRLGGSMRRIIAISATQRIFLWLVVLAMLAVSLFESQVSNILKFFTFNGSEFAKTLLRRDYGGTPYYVYNVALSSVMPFFVMVSYCNDLGRLKLRRPSPLTVMLFGVVLLGKLGTLSKAPPVIFILQLLLLRTLLKNTKINLKVVLLFVLAALVLFMAIVRLTFPELDLQAALEFLYYRSFDIPNQSLLEYFAAIPASIPHTWGSSVLAMFGIAQPKETLETYFAVAELTRDSTASSSNAMFIADAWAQFSWFGVVLVSTAVGLVIRLIDLYARRGGYSDQTICLIAGCAFGIFTILSTSFTTGLVTGGLALIPLISTFFVRRRPPGMMFTAPAVNPSNP